MTKRRAGQCWECFQRRLVCDLTRPSCKKCISLGKKCSGYGTKPLKWLAPGQSRAKGAHATVTYDISAQTTKAARVAPDKRHKKASGNIGGISQGGRNDSADSGDVPPPNAARASWDASARQLTDICLASPRYSSEDLLLMQAIEYNNLQIAPDLVASGITGTKNPFFVPPGFAPYMPKTIRGTLLCAVLSHRICGTDESLAGVRKELSASLQRHRGEAIKSLSAELRSHSHDTPGSVIVLLLTEIQHCMSVDWWQHIGGASTLINMNGGLSRLIRPGGSSNHIYSLFASIHVLGATTSPAMTHGQAQDQLELMEHIDLLHGEEMLLCVPCPPEIVKRVISINIRRSSLRSEGLYDEGARNTEAYNILGQIMTFSSASWARKISRRVAIEHQSAKGGGNLVDSSPASWDWERLGRIYQTAAALYCVATLSDADSNVELRSMFQETLLRDLKQTSVDPMKHLRKLVLWPVSILGLTLRHDSFEAQQYVLSELSWTSSALGTASALVAKDLLRQIWRVKSEKSWEQLFDRPYAFVL